jgi:outer membrane protein assembly factor BamA
VQFDNRDNQNDAVRGWLIAANLRQYLDGIAGGDSRWQEAFAQIRTYRALTADKRHRLAFWTYGDFVTKGVAPYLSLPMSGGDLDERSNRGYAQGRFRGEQMVYGEIEYRGLVTRNGLIGVVSFVNAATLSNRETGEKLFHSAAVGGGAGLRVLLSKRSRANICLDAGVGRNGSRGVYFGLNDAF